MISILMPIYNGIEFIDESVGSILNQSYTQWELLIGINGHPPNSDVYQIAQKFQSDNNKIRVFDLFNLKSKVATLNELVKHCNFNYIALLDVDDIWHNDKLFIQSEFLHNYDVIGAKCIYFGDKNGFIPDIPIHDFSQADFFIGNPIINSSVIIKKELCFWIDNGIEDYDLWLRLKSQHKKFYNCHQILVKHRIHQSSAFNSKGNNLLVSDLLKKHS